MKKNILILIFFLLAILVICGIVYGFSILKTNNVEAAAVDVIEQAEENEVFEIILENTEIDEKELAEESNMLQENEEGEHQEENNTENETTENQPESTENKSEEKQSEQAQENKTQKQQTQTNTNVSGGGGSPYYIKVNNQANVVTIYGKDENGNYTKPIKAMICSTGRATPSSGKYTIKSRWEWLNLINGVYGHYSTQIVGNILFHSVPYTEKYNPGSLEYWEYDKLRNSMFCRMCKINNSRCLVDIPLCTTRYNCRVLFRF